MDRCIVKTVEDWQSGSCTEYVKEGQPQQFFDDLFSNFYGDHSGLYIPGIGNPDPTQEQLEFQYLLRDVCNMSEAGGKCRFPLLNKCQNYTRDDTQHPIVRQICGCYLRDSQYIQVTSRSCDNICSGTENIKYFPTPESTSPQECQESVCVIDDVTIKATSSTVGDITFQQLCSDCPEGNCRCIISDINVISRDSQLGKLNIEQNCSTTQCFDSGNVAVDCKQYESSFGLNISALSEEKQKATMILIGLIIASILIFILLLISIFE